MSESGEVKEASKPGVAKATSSIFPSVEVIQGEPVSNEVPVEGLAPSFSDRPEVAKQGTDPVQVQVGAKAPPFMLELFCGTAGVCTIPHSWWPGDWRGPPLEACVAKGSCSEVGPDAGLGPRADYQRSAIGSN